MKPPGRALLPLGGSDRGYWSCRIQHIPVGGSPGFTGQNSFGPGRFLASVVVLTNVETNEKKYAVMNPANVYRFHSIVPGVVYIEEIKSKRVGLPFGPRVTPRIE